MARKTILVCDNCGKEVDEAQGAVMRLSWSDARRGAKEADLCGDCATNMRDCATNMPGRQVARRGRRPKNAATAQ
jgi:hypothetical protein